MPRKRPDGEIGAENAPCAEVTTIANGAIGNRSVDGRWVDLFNKSSSRLRIVG
jgi:hypothetical protein